MDERVKEGEDDGAKVRSRVGACEVLAELCLLGYAAAEL